MPLEKKAPRTPRPPQPAPTKDDLPGDRNHHTPPWPPTPAPPRVEPPVTTPATLGSYGNASIDQWDSAFIAASDAVFRKKGVRVDPLFLKGMMDVESGGNGKLAPGWCRSDGSCGPMQIKPQFHQYRCPECDFSTVPGQIELAAHIIGDTMKERGMDEYGALTSVYFPASDILNGTTQSEYVKRVKNLVAIMKGGTTPAPKPKPKPMQDPIRVIVGGDYPPIDYGFGSDVGLSYYAYGVGHGTQRATQHTGYDVGVACGTRLYSPIAGVVDCVGSRGTPRWGQGCGAYADVDGGGVGNITILGDSGHKLTLGHCHTATVKPGDRVSAGQQVGTVGSMNGCHVHVEVSVNRGGTYWLVDPGPALREAMGGEAVVTYAERVPFVLSDDNPEKRITVTAESVPVLQYANPDAAAVRAPLPKGEEFLAGTQVLGTDGKWWYLTSIGSRIPTDGTKEKSND